MTTPSDSEELNRSNVTSPPMRIPGIQWGSGNTGSLNKTVPGIGTPMRIPITARTVIIQIANLSVQLNERPHGAFSLVVKTITDITPTAVMANHGALTRTTAVARVNENIHHVNG